MNCCSSHDGRMIQNESLICLKKIWQMFSSYEDSHVAGELTYGLLSLNRSLRPSRSVCQLSLFVVHHFRAVYLSDAILLHDVERPSEGVTDLW